SISAIDVNTGKRVWKFITPEPERGGVTTTDGGVGFAGGGDGVLRAFDLKTGKVLFRFQTGAPIAAGPSVYSVDRREYVAITVGGTPTSSNGGTVTQLHVFALGQASAQSFAPGRSIAQSPALTIPAHATPAARPTAAPPGARRQGFGRIVT